MSEQIKIGPLTITGEPRFDGKAFATTVSVGPSTCGGPPLALAEWYALHQAAGMSRTFAAENARLRELCRKPLESLADYKVRLDILIDAHLGGCAPCNYDKECMECAADGDGTAHSCNCGHGPGYGYQLYQTLKIARLALAAEGK